MIDLHTHTNRSDGDLGPEELVDQAVALGLEALGITDHDTLEGFDAAVGAASRKGLQLICGIELSTRPAPGAVGEPAGKRAPSVHLLGYFLGQGPSEEFRQRLLNMQASRRERNTRLVEKLRSLGVEISLEEVRVLGSYQTARPHFAQVLLKKGYVSTMQEAFDRYLADNAQASVPRDEPSIEEGIQDIRKAGGLASLAHPVRLPCGRDREKVSRFVGALVGEGLNGIEVYHSEHTPADSELYLELARKYGLAITGGTDFHGEKAKPGVRLGTGRNGNVAVTRELLAHMQASS